MAARHGRGAGPILSRCTSPPRSPPRGSPKRNLASAAARISEAQLSICRRAAALECELEATEARLSEGQQVDLDQYARLTSRLCRLFELIGTRRLTRPVDPLSELAKAVEGYAAAPIDDDDGDENEPLSIEEAMDREPGEAYRSGLVGATGAVIRLHGDGNIAWAWNE